MIRAVMFVYMVSAALNGVEAKRLTSRADGLRAEAAGKSETFEADPPESHL
jgi:hypothetical protein